MWCVLDRNLFSFLIYAETDSRFLAENIYNRLSM